MALSRRGQVSLMPVSRRLARGALRAGIVLLSLSALATAASTHAADAPAGERIVEPAPASPDHVVVEALVAAIDPDEAAGFAAYLALVHPDRRRDADGIAQLRRYSWKRFRKQAADYVLAGTRGGFLLTRRDPVTVTQATTHVRLFLMPINHPRRTSATPIRLQRHDGAWRITANSL